MRGRLGWIGVGAAVAVALVSACRAAPESRLVRQRLFDTPSVLASTDVDTMRVGGDLRRTVRLAAPASITLPVSAESGDTLSFGVVVRPLTARVTLRAWARSGSARRPLHEETLYAQRPWTDRSVALARGDRSVEFEFTGDAADVGLSEPRVLGSGPSKPNVIIYLVDCLRADRVGAYGYARRVTPSIDRLASLAHVFERAFACAAWTKPSVGCLFTGQDAPRHGARTVAAALDPKHATLASLLAAGGYTTAAFVANPVLEGKDFGYARGFDQYVELAAEWQGRAVNNVNADASEITAAVIPWIDHNKDRPFFLYLHSLDLHYPYRARQAPKPLVQPGSKGQQLDSDLYDSELQANDAEIGRLLDALRAAGLEATTHVILTADHGEEFGEHGTARHGHSLFDELLHVPLIVRTAGQGSGSRITANVSNIDIVPTVLDLVGQRAPQGLEGVSLQPLIEGRSLPPRTLFAEQITADELIYAARRGHHKRIREILPRRREMLFDLLADPGERNDLVSTAPKDAQELKADLDLFVQAAQSGHHVVLADPPPGREMHAEITSAGRILELLSLQFETGDVARPSSNGGPAVLRYIHAGARRILLVRTYPEDAALKLRILEGGRELPKSVILAGSPPTRTDPPRIRAWVYHIAAPAGAEKLSPESLERMKALGYIN